MKYCLHPPASPFRTKDSPSRNLPLLDGKILKKKEIKNHKYLACLSAWLTAGLDFIFLMLNWSAKVETWMMMMMRMMMMMETCSSVSEVSKYFATVLEIKQDFGQCG